MKGVNSIINEASLFENPKKVIEQQCYREAALEEASRTFSPP